MQGMWFILAAALLTQLLWEVPSIICTVQVVILSVIIPTCWEAAVGLLSTITPPLTPPTPTSTAGHQLTTDHHVPQIRVKGLEETIYSLLIQTSAILTFSFLPFSNSSFSSILSQIQIFVEKMPILHICLVEETAISLAELVHPSILFPRVLTVQICG